jgi:predicted DNA-binding protein with PD1-like motif
MENIRIQSTVSQEGRRIIGRILPGTDLIQGIEAICLQNNVGFGIIVSIIGSLQKAEFTYPVPDITNKMGIRYCDPVKIEGPIDLLSCQGVVGRTEDGETSIHIHAVICDANMRVYGGHFLAKGNPILGTGEILIQECNDAKIVREHDEETEFMMFKFYPKNNK